MSANNQEHCSASGFTSMFQTACDEYQRLTGQDPSAHPFSKELENCNSPGDVLNVLRERSYAVTRFRTDDEKLLVWLNPIVHVLFAFSTMLGEGIGLVSVSISVSLCLDTASQPFSPAKTIFTGIVVLLGVRLSRFSGARPCNT